MFGHLPLKPPYHHQLNVAQEDVAVGSVAAGCPISSSPFENKTLYIPKGVRSGWRERNRRRAGSGTRWRACWHRWPAQWLGRKACQTWVFAEQLSGEHFEPAADRFSTGLAVKAQARPGFKITAVCNVQDQSSPQQLVRTHTVTMV